MYYDKRFQEDLYFPMIAFNHEQIAASSTASNIMVKRADFPRIMDKLSVLNVNTLGRLTRRLEEGEGVIPETEDERNCFDIMRSLDFIGAHVQGSVTAKKYMRNEIWSLINFIGAPSWFVTLSPSDSSHPIALYFADKNLEFKPTLRTWKERSDLVARNPVAAARFFNVMVKAFIKHVLGVGSAHRGLYGPTSAYYAAVEQQDITRSASCAVFMHTRFV
ncbi:uncharacterized protein SCHCODRAFT_02673452 [Schizophyllum commune H4-8]|uniref:uncharacterized protein n=1 Tax=Schizophyllum commune (strain H4-8 / FGSC 9210) TaxID=578458 RepID=UPI00215E1355|nr:uncharacterized protein SCHCODRAFT_02673452 [Schizophyllum commune H4-8]KAI5885744.1 hypothetical protein SCHCODRAFT_02673452 [Schizophyllum commune H4-8]